MSAFTTSDGLRLAYSVDDFTDPWAPRETVVLLHAAMANRRRFYAWVPSLARRYRIVRVDTRGHGESETPGPAHALDVARQACDVIELLDRLEIERAHVSGSSAGGYVAQQLAIAHPARVDRLALFSSTPGLAWARPEAAVATWPATVRARGVDGLLRSTVTARVDPARVPPGFVDWMLDEARGMDRAFTARFLETMARLDLADRLPEIRARTLVVIPGADTVCRPEGYAALRRIPDHRVVVYAGLPHNITNGAPERCVADLLGFLAET